jgi:hypothetical protein
MFELTNKGALPECRIIRYYPAFTRGSRAGLGAVLLKNASGFIPSRRFSTDS